MRRLWPLLALCYLPAGHAQCSIANPSLMTSGGAILSSNTIRFSKDVRMYRYVFSVKCGSATRYRLGLQGTDPALPPGTLLLSNPRGDQVVMRARLKSVGGSEINADLAALPGGIYEGTVAAEQSQEVVMELRPTDVKPRGPQVSGGDYQGGGTIRLVY